MIGLTRYMCGSHHIRRYELFDTRTETSAHAVRRLARKLKREKLWNTPCEICGDPVWHFESGVTLFRNEMTIVRWAATQSAEARFIIAHSHGVEIEWTRLIGRKMLPKPPPKLNRRRTWHGRASCALAAVLMALTMGVIVEEMLGDDLDITTTEQRTYADPLL